MTLSRRVAFLLTGLLLFAAGGHAQTALGQPTLEERKVQIWCATAKFVYDDTGHPELKSQLKCGGPLKDFAGSIKADEQRVYSALYQPLEVQGVMYKGLGSDNSRLQTLVREIINRLRTSPSRKGNTARLAGVTRLEAALKNYLDKGTPIGELAATDEAAPAEVVDTTDEATAAAPGDAGLDEAGVASPTPAASAGAGEGLMNKLFAPLALIMALLSLVLYALMRKNLGEFQKELSARIDKRRDEIMALQTTPTGSSKSGERFSPAQLRELEQLIQQRVEQELQQRRASAPTPGAAPVASVAPAAPAVAPPPAAAPVAPAPAPVAAVPSAPVTAPVLPAPGYAAEVPAAVPAGPPSAATHEEFDSLVAPVQLPSVPAAPPVAPAPAAPPVEDQLRTRYVKVPVNGAFNEFDLTDEPQHDSIYEVYFDPQWPELATFSVTQNPAVHAYAIQSAQYSLREACKYQQPAGPVSRIVTEEEGVLRRVGSSWQIEQKATIRFE